LRAIWRIPCRKATEIYAVIIARGPNSRHKRVGIRPISGRRTERDK
jgi:hypothetical protein